MINFLYVALLIFVPTVILAEVKEIPSYDWGQNLINAPSQNTGKGHQVLHFGQADYPYQNSPEGVLFVNKYLKNAKPLISDAYLLRYASDQVTLNGAYIELGVTTGKTINFIAALNPAQIIYGFDSFQGNPEDYIREGKHYSKGIFGLKDLSKTPPVLSNVKLIQGPFSESLPYFIEKYLHKQPIAFLHIDVDIYSSTKNGLDILTPYIVPGTIIVFDEFYAFPEYEQAEYKAFHEFLTKTGYQAEYIAYNTNFEGVAVRIQRSTKMK